MPNLVDIKFYKKLAENINWKGGTPYWKNDMGTRKTKGKEAGTIKQSGYRVIGITLDGQKVKIRSARLRWFMEYNELPEVVDHKDRVKLNDNISNLRNCTHAQNMQNQKKAPGGSSKYIGVYWDRIRKRWTAEIHAHGKKYFLGRFKDEKEAARAYDKGAKIHHKEFATLNFK